MQVMENIESKDQLCYPVHPLLEARWSPRAFSSRPVEPEKLRSLFEAARSAPSSYNAQPWSFIAAPRDDREAYDRLLGTLVEANQKWAAQAPVLMLSVAKLRFDHNGQPNRHAFHDVGQSVAYLTFQATALGLSVHQMAGFDVEKAREAFGIPPGYEPVAAIALGYVDESLAGKTPPRGRKPLDEFVFRGRWGHKPKF